MRDGRAWSPPIKDADALAALADADAVLVRSGHPDPADALADAGKLKVIGRAGRRDTIDVEAATARGIAVMNAPRRQTPSGRRRARDLAAVRAGPPHPGADAGMKAGQWPKSGLTGFELEARSWA